MSVQLSSKAFRVVFATIACVVLTYSAFSWYCSKCLARFQRDSAAVQEYVDQVQPQLAADSRFREVTLLGCRASTILYSYHPYMPVMGRVASKKDWEALDMFIRESKPPVFTSVRTVWIEADEDANNNE
jgi:hypothetical protein